MTAMSHRMNEIMKVLTIVGTVFIPITFLAGVYGMNFKHMPELELTWTYPSFWILCLAASGGMLYWLRTRGWL
jgi:magnesium transporter